MGRGGGEGRRRQLPPAATRTKAAIRVGGMPRARRRRFPCPGPVPRPGQLRLAAGPGAFAPHLGAAEVAELQLVGLRVDQQVLRLDVAVADAVFVDVPEGAAHLVGVQLDKNGGHPLVVLAIGFADPASGGQRAAAAHARERQPSTQLLLDSSSSRSAQRTQHRQGAPLQPRRGARPTAAAAPAQPGTPTPRACRRCPARTPGPGGGRSRPSPCGSRSTA